MFVRLIIIALFSFFVMKIQETFLKLKYFNLTKINITGNAKMLQTELTSLVNNLYNKNNFDIDYSELKKTLENDVRLSSVEIKEVGLGEIDINVEEKDFSYYTIIKKEVYLVDENGDLFGYINEKKKESVPLIVANTREEVKELVGLLNKVHERQLFHHISQAYKKLDEEYIIVLRDGTKIKTDLIVESDKYRILETLYSEMKKNKKIDYIDLRFDDYIIKYMGDEWYERQWNNQICFGYREP